jgi:excisionase family DNA binding protein
MEKYLKVKEVAEELRVSTMTVHRLLTAGKLKGISVGRAWRIREASLREYLDQN